MPHIPLLPPPLAPNRSASPHTRRLPARGRAALLWAFLPTAALLALPALLTGALIWWRASKTWDYRERWSGTWLLAVVGLAAYAAVSWAAHPLPSLLAALFAERRESFPTAVLLAVGKMWLLHLCFAPACALVLAGLRPLARRSWAESLLPAGPVASSLPPAEPLGVSLGGDLYEWLRGGQLCLPVQEMWRHGTVVGEPGFGKTMTLLRLAAIAARYGMQVIFLDLKGSQQTAAQFVASMRALGVGRVAVYPGQAYDGWRGDAESLYNRLMALVDAGTHPYYRRITSALVSLVVRAPEGPPRSSREFLARLDEKWLKSAYTGRDHWYEQRAIAKLGPHIYEASLTYDGFFGSVAGGLDGAFAYEDADAVYIGLDADALREQAVSVARYLLEDAAHYARRRKAPGVRALCVIDEFGALGVSNVAGLYERMREAGLSMWASAQSYQGLGPERESVLAASAIKILHRCGDPLELVKFAGQREVPAFSHTLDEEGSDSGLGLDEPGSGSGGRTTVRMQRQYAVPIEEVQQLALGTVALIAGGLHAWVQVYPVALPEDLLRDAVAFVSARPEEAPASLAHPVLGQSRDAAKKASTPAPLREEGPRAAVEELKSPRVPPPLVPAASGPGPGLQTGEDDGPVDF